MSEEINPYYNPEKLDLELLSFDEPNLSYEYNTLCFWVTKDGRVYSASDSGCSCPTPFEGYSSTDQGGVTMKLERVATIAHAESILLSWGKSYDGSSFLSLSDKEKLSEWIKSALAKAEVKA